MEEVLPLLLGVYLIGIGFSYSIISEQVRWRGIKNWLFTVLVLMSFAGLLIYLIYELCE